MVNAFMAESQAADAIEPNPFIEYEEPVNPRGSESSDRPGEGKDPSDGNDADREHEHGPLNDVDRANYEVAGCDAPRTPRPPTWRHPLASTKAYLSDLSSFFTWKFLSWLAIDKFCGSRAAQGLIDALLLPLFKELGIGASRQQLYNAIISSPWAMKPFIGVASDLFPIGGYNKRYLAALSIIAGATGCSFLLGLHHSGMIRGAAAAGGDAVQRVADVMVTCFTAVSFEAAALDILAEGKYAELMHLHPQSGSSIISFKFGWQLLGSLVTLTYVGPVSDAGHFHVLFWIVLFFSLTPFYPTLAGWIPEKIRTIQEPGMAKLCGGCLFDKESFQEKMAPFLFITLCGLSAPLLATLTTFANLSMGLVFSSLFLVLFLVATFRIFPISFSRILLAVVLLNVSWISIGSALGYYYTASEKCVPGGPNFDYTYYITITGIVGSIVNFLAVILYQSTLSSWRFRSVLIFTIVVGSLAATVDLAIIMRWNTSLGIPDSIFFLLGHAVFENLLGILYEIPLSSIFAKMSPPGMESAVFAYTVGIYNFCSMVSSLLGSGIIKWSGMVTIGESCDFSALPYLVMVFMILLPMLVGIPACFLIPNNLQTEHLIDWEKEEWYEGGSKGRDSLGHDGNRNDEKGVLEEPLLETNYV